MKSNDIHIWAISQEIPQPSITEIHLKITFRFPRGQRVKCTSAQTSNGLPWLQDFKRTHQGNSPSNGRQGDITLIIRFLPCVSTDLQNNSVGNIQPGMFWQTVFPRCSAVADTRHEVIQVTGPHSRAQTFVGWVTFQLIKKAFVGWVIFHQNEILPVKHVKKCNVHWPLRVRVRVRKFYFKSIQ